MLIVRRRKGEAILIGDNVELEILDISPTQVKIGIRAPKEVAVFRKEIRITREANVAAANGAASPATIESFVGKLRTTDNGQPVGTIPTGDAPRAGPTSGDKSSADIEIAAPCGQGEDVAVAAATHRVPLRSIPAGDVVGDDT